MVATMSPVVMSILIRMKISTILTALFTEWNQLHFLFSSIIQILKKSSKINSFNETVKTDNF